MRTLFLFVAIFSNALTLTSAAAQENNVGGCQDQTCSASDTTDELSLLQSALRVHAKGDDDEYIEEQELIEGDVEEQDQELHNDIFKARLFKDAKVEELIAQLVQLEEQVDSKKADIMSAHTLVQVDSKMADIMAPYYYKNDGGQGFHDYKADIMAEGSEAQKQMLGGGRHHPGYSQLAERTGQKKGPPGGGKSGPDWNSGEKGSGRTKEKFAKATANKRKAAMKAKMESIKKAENNRRR